MSPAVASLIALLVVLAASLTSRINVGVLAVALAWPIALFLAGWKPDALAATFPASLFLTLLGVTLLFGVAQTNGTLTAVAHRAVRLCRGQASLLPVFFFLLACGVSTIGPGAIASAALVAPLAMSIGASAGVSPFLVALMVCNGANAGNLSPISSVGVIVHTLMEADGLGGHYWGVWAANFVAHALVSIPAFFLFGGLELRRAGRVAPPDDRTPLEWRHWLTLAVTAVWVVGVVVFRMHLGFAAAAAASVLILARTGDDVATMKSVPWAVIVMVSGVTVLVGVLEKTGGMDLFTTMLARISTSGTVNGTIAFVTGLISVYASTSGVVYPAFLPAVPGLVEKLGGGDPLQVALSVNVGAALVDVSPLSTIGALCLAAIPAGHDAKALFRRMLAWGVAMAFVGALFCQFAIRLFAG